MTKSEKRAKKIKKKLKKFEQKAKSGERIGPARMGKMDLYYARLKDVDHRGELFVKGYFFQDKRLTVLHELQGVCKKFNNLVERETGGIEYSVILNQGTTRTAADFEYQYRKFQKFIRDFGLLPDIQENLLNIRAVQLFKCCTYKQASGMFSLRLNIFESMKNLSMGARVLYFLYKSRCNRPNQRDDGITGLADTSAGEIIGRNRGTIRGYRKELQDHGFVDVVSDNGRHKTLRVNDIS